MELFFFLISYSFGDLLEPQDFKYDLYDKGSKIYTLVFVLILDLPIFNWTSNSLFKYTKPKADF